jgi:hypothetical protein
MSGVLRDDDVDGLVV